MPPGQPVRESLGLFSGGRCSDAPVTLQKPWGLLAVVAALRGELEMKGGLTWRDAPLGSTSQCSDTALISKIFTSPILEEETD